MLIDTHCHLDAPEFDADREQVALMAKRAGVHAIVIPAVERGNWQRVCELSHTISGASYALGIHPMYVSRASDEDLEALVDAVHAALDDPKFVAVGEIGLDFFDPAAREVETMQHRFFRAQLDIAARFGLPVLLHVRRSQDQVLKQLRRVPLPGGIAHAFNGSDQQANLFTGLGFKLGFGGAMTYERALQIRRHARQLSMDSIVLETDAPDIAPSWLRHQRNTPVELPRMAAQLAELRAMSVNELAECTTRNALAAIPRLTRLVIPDTDQLPADD